MSYRFSHKVLNSLWIDSFSFPILISMLMPDKMQDYGMAMDFNFGKTIDNTL